MPRTRPGDMHEQHALNAPDLMVVVQQGALQQQYYLVHLVLSWRNLDAQADLGVD